MKALALTTLLVAGACSSGAHAGETIVSASRQPGGAAARVTASGPSRSTAGVSVPVAIAPTRARAADGAFISWREHRIDDEDLGGVPIRGGDGLWMADLDRDGHLDIASVHESDTEYDGVADGHVRVAFGSAHPHRWELRTLVAGEVAGAPEDVVAADLDGDDYPDLVVGCELGHILFLRNPGASSRTAPWPSLIVPGTAGRGSFIRVTVADFDRDGRPEVAAANKGDQNPGAEARAPRPISWFSIAGDPLAPGSWTEHELIRVDWPINVDAMDVDLDGDLDLFAGSRGEGRVMWFENLGTTPPTFAQRGIEIANGADSDLPALRRASGFNVGWSDLSGDGRPDLVLRQGEALLWLEQPARPAAPDAAWASHAIGSIAPDNLVGFALADIDGDGDADVLAGAYSGGPRDRDGDVGPSDALGGIAWFQNPGTLGGVWPRHDISRRKRGMFDEFVARDMDSDGDVDFVGTRGNSARFDGVFWLEQVRTREPIASFERARAEDSEEVPRLSQ